MRDVCGMFVRIRIAVTSLAVRYMASEVPFDIGDFWPSPLVGASEAGITLGDLFLSDADRASLTESTHSPCGLATTQNPMALLPATQTARKTKLIPKFPGLRAVAPPDRSGVGPRLRRAGAADHGRSGRLLVWDRSRER